MATLPLDPRSTIIVYPAVVNSDDDEVRADVPTKITLQQLIDLVIAEIPPAG